MTLLHEMRSTCNAEIAFRDFVKCANLYDVATLLHEMQPQASSIRCDSAPLSRGQFQLWAYQQANEGSVDYNMPFLMEVKGRKAHAFVESLCRALKDQELFSCTLGGEIDTPFLQRNEALQIPVRQTDFPDSVSAQRYFGERIHTPFDLRSELPVRVEIARLADSLQVLLLVHHIAGDAESIEILLNNALQYARGGEAAKGLLATQAEFCRREDAYLRSAEFKADQAYWDRVFAPLAAALHPSVRRKGAMAVIDLPPELEASLQRLAENAGATLLCSFATLLGDFLRKRHGRREILVGVPVGLRETRAEFETTGFYVGTVALRLQEHGETRRLPRRAWLLAMTMMKYVQTG